MNLRLALIVLLAMLGFSGGVAGADDSSLTVEEEPAIQASPLAQAHLDRSRALQEKGEVEAAAEEVDKALSLSTRLPSAHFRRAELLRGQGDTEGAVREYTRAIEALALDQFLR